MFRTVAVVALICLTVSPAASAGPGQQYSVRNPSTGTGEGDVADAQHRVSELKAVVGQRQAAVVAAQQEVDRLAVAVTEARRELEAARAREQQAIAEETAQQAREAAAELTVRKHREELGRWASVSYRNGVSNEQMRNLQVLLGAADLDHYARTKLVLQQSGSGYAELIDQAQAAEQARHNAALKAAQAHEAALAAVEDAQGAALRADAAAAEQAVKTAELNALLQAAEQEMDEAEQEAARLRAQQWQARPDSKPGNGRPNVVTGPVGDCQGADTSPYGNGQAPLSALCPLWSAPGEHLRADAAYAFNMMSMEYARTFGQPICVTDSYRPLAEQVAVKIAKPYLAAKPGTSNHGWGIAVDLCGGINRFGTPQHVWMQNNAGKFAFHHPSWAQAGGSKPEAWHWEFAG